MAARAAMVSAALKTLRTAIGSEDSAKQAYEVLKYTLYHSMLVLEINGQKFKASRQRRRYHYYMA
jgi:hypothetical protein